MANKTIVEKLKLNNYPSKVIINLPEPERPLFNQLMDYDHTYCKDKYDLIVIFVLTLDELKDRILDIIEHNRLNKNGYMYIAYPKKGNKIYPNYVHRDEIFPSLNVDDEGYVGNSTIKFARMVSLNETFTIIGLKEFASGKGKKSTASSQCVDDYIDYISHIEAYLSTKSALLEFYKKLTPGYRKDWARYVYSAKQDATRNKRLTEMEMILGKGFKSKDLYRQSLS
ncbi:YdeI/OmpD-associated family protein [Sporolactobacillus laevolacticus]|uniref:LAAC n=1 Tax=Sporolactobacillus laevolacticus DSM 442 TaxID=1395513 RepID=V6IZD3_9BACL|nr:YdeI/OmpD-associated family protein [Sporolactobacillus laevolacticus]EST12867.1 hypothetical protein P343_04275 [Sporolactobacillus laevolacticus DSM 442]